MSNWRPKSGWKNPYPTLLRPDEKQENYVRHLSKDGKIFEAGADAMHKADIEWLMQFRHDCIECGWTITPDHEAWQAFTGAKE